LDAATGDVRWETPVDPQRYGNPTSPVIANGVVYVINLHNGDQAYLCFFDANTGESLGPGYLNSPDLGKYTSTTPTVANGRVYIGASGGEYSLLEGGNRLYCFGLDESTSEAASSSQGPYPYLLQPDPQLKLTP
jgi:outer membrane protein assembly factor BamB